MKLSTLVLALIVSTQILAEEKVMEPVLLGSTKLARHYTDMDSINFKIPKCGLSEIQLHINNRPSDIDHVFIQYGNGNTDEKVVRERFARGSKSRWLDLRGLGERCLTKIVIIGESEGRALRRSEVEVFGR